MPILGVRVDQATHRAFKLWCVQRDRKMSDVLRRLVLDWIADQERLQKKLEELEAEKQMEEGRDG